MLLVATPDVVEYVVSSTDSDFLVEVLLTRDIIEYKINPQENHICMHHQSLNKTVPPFPTTTIQRNLKAVQKTTIYLLLCLISLKCSFSRKRF